jgi:hypothetical protein
MKHTIKQPAQQQNLYAQLQEEAARLQAEREASMQSLIKEQEKGIQL